MSSIDSSLGVDPSGKSDLEELDTEMPLSGIGEAPVDEDNAVGDPDGEGKAGSESSEQDEDSSLADEEKGRLISGDFISRMGAFLASLMVHLIGLVILALLTIPILKRDDILSILAAVSPDELEVLEEIEAVQEFTSSDSTSLADSAETDSTFTAPSSMDVTSPVLLEAGVAAVEDALPQIDIVAAIQQVTPGEMAQERGEGAPGEARAVVDNYDQAFDRLTMEILTMLESSKVLVVWCFDQSGSMKDDQKTIRDRIDKVYSELGIKDIASGGSLTTGVTSFGKRFVVHLDKPTENLEQIKKAIDAVPTDASGEEITSSALALSINRYSEYARRSRRRMALILVSDESGNRADHDVHLEDTISLARDSRCHIYIMGREAVFGYPYAHISWEHPQTFVIHYLPVDRGPESGFVEQLQTEGFHRRLDSHPSGFGPYEQSRMARETGGIFFMLPSVELDVVDLDERRYRLDSMRPYRPDLKVRQELLDEIAKTTMRSGLTKIIYEMNPYNPEAAKIIDMRTNFSINPQEFIQQVKIEQAKALVYMGYLDRMRTALEEIWHERDQEVAPRWQANADLMRAQLLCYKIRLYEYGAYLNEFVKKPKIASARKEPNLHFIHWNLGRRQKMITGEVTREYVAQAKGLFADVVANHPDTPWAARAEKELSSGFGVELHPYYRRRPTGGGNQPLIPVPKL